MAKERGGGIQVAGFGSCGAGSNIVYNFSSAPAVGDELRCREERLVCSGDLIWSDLFAAGGSPVIAWLGILTYDCPSVGPCLPERTVLISQHSCLMADATSFPQPVLTAASFNVTLFRAIGQVSAFSPNSEWCYFAVQASRSKGSGIKHHSLNWYCYQLHTRQLHYVRRCRRLLDRAYLIRFRCGSKRKKTLPEFG